MQGTAEQLDQSDVEFVRQFMSSEKDERLRMQAR